MGVANIYACTCSHRHTDSHRHTNTAFAYTLQGLTLTVARLPGASKMYVRATKRRLPLAQMGKLNLRMDKQSCCRTCLIKCSNITEVLTCCMLNRSLL